jgi:hypothetical protein
MMQHFILPWSLAYSITNKNNHSSSIEKRKRRLGKGVKREVTPEFVNMSKETLYPQIQGVTGTEPEWPEAAVEPFRGASLRTFDQ